MLVTLMFCVTFAVEIAFDVARSRTHIAIGCGLRCNYAAQSVHTGYFVLCTLRLFTDKNSFIFTIEGACGFTRVSFVYFFFFVLWVNIRIRIFLRFSENAFVIIDTLFKIRSIQEFKLCVDRSISQSIRVTSRFVQVDIAWLYSITL